MVSARIGAMLRREIPPAAVLEAAAAAAPFVDEIWVVEDLPYAGGISQATAVLMATDDVLVGHGIAPAPFRNPAALAMEWATLAEMFPGRFVAGIGHGVQSWMAQIGERVASPVTLLHETTTAVRRLIHGERVTMDGRYVTLRDVALEYPPATPPPILAGVRGPRSLELAGAIADGAILGEGNGPDDIASARAHMASGGARTGRADHHLTVFAAFSIGETPPWRLSGGDWLAVGGSDEVAERLRSLIDAGADSVVLVPHPADPVAQMSLASEMVIPRLRSA
jgi:alkanesulfonate monooxygenase SsuD/methylene tetrahydromethanopterin reductase-like flavin-dependent oxidoreductase (luciferase family)